MYKGVFLLTIHFDVDIILCCIIADLKSMIAVYILLTTLVVYLNIFDLPNQ